MFTKFVTLKLGGYMEVNLTLWVGRLIFSAPKSIERERERERRERKGGREGGRGRERGRESERERWCWNKYGT